MKHFSLDNRGIAHFIIPMAVIVMIAIGGTVYKVQSHAATCHDYRFDKGANSQCVRYAQTILNGVGAYYGGGAYGTKRGVTLDTSTLTTDGNFGQKTYNKLLNFERWSGYAAHGVIDQPTWQALCNYGGYSGMDRASRTAATAAGCPSYK